MGYFCYRDPSASESGSQLKILNPKMFQIGGVGASFMCGAWFRQSAAIICQIFQLDNIGGGGTSFRNLQVSTGGVLTFNIDDGTGGSSTATVSSPTAVQDRWYFGLLRYISTSAYRVSGFDPVTGTVGHGSSTNNISATDDSALFIGNILTGATLINFSIGDLWFATGTVGSNTANLDDSLVRRLALYGPESIGWFANQLLYRFPFNQNFNFISMADYKFTGSVFNTDPTKFGMCENAPVMPEFKRQDQIRRLLPFG